MRVSGTRPLYCNLGLCLQVNTEKATVIPCNCSVSVADPVGYPDILTGSNKKYIIQKIHKKTGNLFTDNS
jgi:hypothetical protein